MSSHVASAPTSLNCELQTSATEEFKDSGRQWQSSLASITENMGVYSLNQTISYTEINPDFSGTVKGAVCEGFSGIERRGCKLQPTECPSAHPLPFQVCREPTVTFR